MSDIEMTFDEWWEDIKGDTYHLDNRRLARAAWGAARAEPKEDDDECEHCGTTMETGQLQYCPKCIPEDLVG